MAEMHQVIESLLDERGISGAKMSADLGMSRSFMTELRKGRAKSIKAETAQKIADYFGVSVSYLLGDTEKAPTQKGERTVDDDDIKFALFGTREIDDDVLNQVKAFAKFARENRKDK